MEREVVGASVGPRATADGTKIGSVPDVIDTNERREGKSEVAPEHREGETETAPHFLKGIVKPVPAKPPIEKAERRLVEIPHEQRRRLHGSLCQKVDLARRRADETDGGILERQVGDDDLERPSRHFDVGPQVRASAGEKHLVVFGNWMPAQ